MNHQIDTHLMVFDPSNNKWTTLAKPPFGGTPKWDQLEATLDENLDAIVVIPGWENKTYLYNISTQSWSDRGANSFFH
jgi:hypothetical protein